jgi:hypothetical protein
MLCAALLLSVGCSKSESGVSVYPVRGTATYGENPAAGARVTFYATSQIDEKTPIPTAVVEADGSFQLTSYKPNDGAPAGEYSVTVTWFNPPPEGVNPESYSPADKLAGRYATPDKTSLKVTVTEGDNELAPFELQ